MRMATPLATWAASCGDVESKLNLIRLPSSGAITLSARWIFADLLGDEVHERDGNELAQRGLYLDLAPHAAQLFHAERC